MKFLYKVNGPSIVELYDAWSEEQGEWYFILMELCDDNLDNILKKKLEVFKRKKEQPMNKLEYFISWHILKEVVDAVEYWNTYWPTMIQPQEIKVCDFLVNYEPKFIKLCDFDISKEHEGSSSNTAGKDTDWTAWTKTWRASDVATRERSRSIIDIDNLVMLALNIFGFDLTMLEKDK